MIQIATKILTTIIFTLVKSCLNKKFQKLAKSIKDKQNGCPKGFFFQILSLKLLMLEIIVKLNTFRKTDPFSLKIVILNKIHSLVF